MSALDGTESAPVWGLMAEFKDPNDLVAAAKATRVAGYTAYDAYSPMPIEELEEAMGLHETTLPLLVLIGGILGGIGGFGLSYWTSVVAYPINVAGRPFNSWQAFIPITFETTILFAAFAAVFGMLALNGLPQPYHPVFNVPSFERASQNRFFLCIERADPHFDMKHTRDFLEKLGPHEISEVPA